MTAGDDAEMDAVRRRVIADAAVKEEPWPGMPKDASEDDDDMAE